MAGGCGVGALGPDPPPAPMLAAPQEERNCTSAFHRRGPLRLLLVDCSPGLERQQEVSHWLGHMGPQFPHLENGLITIRPSSMQALEGF